MTLKKTKELQEFRKLKESRIERHDRYNFEAKIDYLIQETEEKKTSYLLEFYLFIPQVLQINQKTYDKEEFFLDLNNRIRFKTPEMSFKGLINEENDLSPINIIRKEIKKIEFGKISQEVKTRIERELRLLACMIKVLLRDQITYFLCNYKTLQKTSDVNELVREYLDKLSNFQVHLNELRDKFLITQVPFKLKEAFQFSQEYISLQVEKWSTTLLKYLGKELDKELRENIINIIEQEQKRRKNLNKRALVHMDDSGNETFSYYKGILKKYVQGVLYLEKKINDPKSPLSQLLYSIAEGAAMFFSLFLTFFLISNFIEYSLPFIIGAIVVYMLKERLKDNAKLISDKVLGLVFPDKRHEIIDEFYQKRIGMSKEMVSFLEGEKIPSEILKIRRSSDQSPLEEKGKPEKVLSYRQKITLLNQEIDDIHTKKNSLTNIMRFNIRDFLKYMDDPYEPVFRWNKEKNELSTLDVSNVYHLNVIYKLTSFRGTEDEEVNFDKFRVILDQDGIKRVEDVRFSL